MRVGSERWRGGTGCLIATAALLCGGVCSADVAEFHSAPILPGTHQTLILGISGDGRTAFGLADVSGALASRPVVWTLEGGVEALPTLTSARPDEAVNASSYDGSVLGGIAVDQSGDARAAYWVEGAGPIFLADDDGCVPVTISAVSRDGSVFAGDALCERPDEPTIVEGYRAEIGGVIKLIGQIETPPYRAQTRSIVHAMSDDGQVLIGSASTGDLMPRVAVRWDQAEGLTELPLLAVGEADAHDISADKRFVAGRVEGGAGYLAAIWEIGFPPEELGDLPGGAVSSSAAAMTPDGQIVVGSSAGLGIEQIPGQEPFVWDRVNGMRNLRTLLILEHGLPLVGRQMSRITGVSDNGRVIVGWDPDPVSGSNNGWMVRFIVDADLDRDTRVTSADLAALLAAWGACDGACPADLNGDSVVDSADLAEMLAAWG